MSADAETRRLALLRERALHDEATVRMIERKEGREEGLDEVLQRLIEFGITETEARQLLMIGYTSNKTAGSRHAE
ncbi:MAG: hypothetical protein ACR2HF_07710 [Methylococcaceae bacterium]